MSVLLDTHVAIWALTSPIRLPQKVRQLIYDADRVHVSVASIWEIAIKFALRRNDPPPFDATTAIGHFRDAGYELLTVAAEHAARLDGLPPLHSDPFDRLLVAQAFHERLILVSANKSVAAYSPSFVSW